MAAPADVRLLLVTDRRRLAACGPPGGDWHARLLRQIEGAVAAGVDYVQIRERDLPARALAQLVREAVVRAAGSRTRVLVNDRLDVALAARAAGVHLREDSAPADRIRLITPHGFVIGRAVHGLSGWPPAGSADFLVAGTIFATASKAPATALLGVEGLRGVVRAAGGTPVFAIGGVSAATAGRLASTGVAGLAAIGAFLPAEPHEDPAQAAEKGAGILRFAFDTVRPRP